jgi:hypothetical protein
MKYISAVRLIAQYLNKVKGQRTFTTKEIQLAGPKAQKWFSDRLPAEYHKKERAILKEDGYTPLSWKAEKDSIRWNDNMYATSRKIQKLRLNYLLIHEIPMQGHSSYTAALIHQAVKRGFMTYVQKKRIPFKYKLTKKHYES